MSAARRAWQALDGAALRSGGLEGRWQERLQIYRAAIAAQAPEVLLSNWRWKLALWRPCDRETFDAVMKDAREKQLVIEAAQKAEAAAKFNANITAN